MSRTKRALRVTQRFSHACGAQEDVCSHLMVCRVMCRVMPVVIALLMQTACSRQINEDLLTQHRNLGKAFYENPATQQEAVREFQQALEIVPDSAREKLNYALALLRASGRDEEVVRLLQEVQRQDPSLPHTWFNLGIYYKRQGDVKRAIAQFEGMIEH